MNNQLINFLVELAKRFGSKNPKFFNVIAIVGTIATVISFLPEDLSAIGITLPASWEGWVRVAVRWAGIAVAVISQLPKEATLVGVTQTGAPVTITDVSKLPFTAKVEEKKMEKIASQQDLQIVTVMAAPTSTSTTLS